MRNKSSNIIPKEMKGSIYLNLIKLKAKEIKYEIK